MSRRKSIAETGAVHVEVVDVDRALEAVGLRGEVEERRDLLADALHPLGHRAAVVELTLGGGPRVADQAGGAADQDDRLVTGSLQRPQHHELEQVADVQALRGGVEAGVVGDRPLGQVLAQGGLVGALGDQPAAVQLVDHVVHRAMGPSCPARRRRGLPPARNTLTDGASVSQNRHGRSVAWLMPTRGPAETAAGAGPRCSRTGAVRRRAGRRPGRPGRWPAPGSAGPGRARGPGPHGRPGGGTGRAPPPPPPRRPAAAPPIPRPSGPTTTLAHQCTP